MDNNVNFPKQTFELSLQNFEKVTNQSHSNKMPQPNQPTLKGRLLTLQHKAKQLKSSLQSNQHQIRHLVQQIQQGTQTKVLQDKINYIKDYLSQKLDRIDYSMKKHLQDQKEKNNQLVELISVVKGEKNQLQRHLAMLEERIVLLQEKIGGQE